LLDRFRSDTASVLFATDSFWEGVDVAGDSLQCVILPKLPFRVPTEPILQARAEAVEAAGGNAFMEYSVPQAVIKFRQGFGRLIRRRTDRGAIVVLDRRIITKYYGKVFIDSLPRIRLIRGPQSGVMEALAEFFGTTDARSDGFAEEEE
jgi:ATP-dependent DNA helicase DinG